MEFSYVDGVRHSPEPGLRGRCDLCGRETLSKCGPIRVHHWAHKRRSTCDPWWETETEWHRKSKSDFPEHCREVVVSSSDGGQKHRADIKTDFGRVIEFQYSPIQHTERVKREAFYGDMDWVVCGFRLDNDVLKFDKSLIHARIISNDPIILQIHRGSCTVLRTWAESAVSVYLDFGDDRADDRFNFPDPILWRLQSDPIDSEATLTPVLRREFVANALTGTPINGISDPTLEVSKPRHRFHKKREPMPIKKSISTQQIAFLDGLKDSSSTCYLLFHQLFVLLSWFTILNTIVNAISRITRS